MCLVGANPGTNTAHQLGSFGKMYPPSSDKYSCTDLPKCVLQSNLSDGWGCSSRLQFRHHTSPFGHEKCPVPKQGTSNDLQPFARPQTMEYIPGYRALVRWWTSSHSVLSRSAGQSRGSRSIQIPQFPSSYSGTRGRPEGAEGTEEPTGAEVN